jgi:hypothetical protein
VIEGLADVVIGAGIVAAGTDEPASVVVDRDLVSAAGEPGQDGAGLPDQVAEVGRHAGPGG